MSLIAVLLLAQTPALPPKLSAQQIAAAVLPSIAAIKTPHSVGTGFVASEGRIATNLEVIGDETALVVVLADRELQEVRVVARDASQGLAVLSFVAPAPGPRVLPLAPVDAAASKPAPVVVAHPLARGSKKGAPSFDEFGRVIAVGGVSIEGLRPLLEQPVIRRAVPSHDVVILKDCSNEDLSAIKAELSLAIAAGAPRYNDGDAGACFRIYEAAARELAQRKRCTQATGALLDGIKRAERLTSPVSKAWAMRDAFDGVLEVMERREAGELEAKARGRQVPAHDVAIFKSCTKAERDAIYSAIASAIDIGAPLYNAGNIEACFRIYQGAALDLSRKLGKCSGPKKALQVGLDRADKLDTPDQRAWAMRDTFDGLLDVLDRAR